MSELPKEIIKEISKTTYPIFKNWIAACYNEGADIEALTAKTAGEINDVVKEVCVREKIDPSAHFIDVNDVMFKMMGKVIRAKVKGMIPRSVLDKA